MRIYLTPDAEAKLRGMRNIPRTVPKVLAAALDTQNQVSVGHITEKRLTGKGPFPVPQGKLGVRTNRLRDSLMWVPAKVDKGGRVTSAIGSDVKYAGIHEFGGFIRPTTVRPKNGKALKFSIGGRVVFAKQVQLPARYMPARRPVRRGILDRRMEYEEGLSQAVLNGISQAMK